MARKTPTYVNSNENPGPGSYDREDSFHLGSRQKGYCLSLDIKGHKFKKKKRQRPLTKPKAPQLSKTTRSSNNTPRAGASPKVHLQRLNSDSNLRFSTSPAVSPVTALKAVAKKFFMGKSVRRLEWLDPGMANPKIQRSPGPANYNMQSSISKKKVKILFL